MATLRTVTVAVLLGCMLLPAPQTIAAAAVARQRAMDVEQACPNGAYGDLVPGAASARGITDSGQTVTLTILVLLDGITLREGKSIAEGVRSAYRPLGIDVRSTYRVVTLAANGRAADGQPTGDPLRLLDQMRSRYPFPPRGFDLVHLLTAKDISLQPNNDGKDGLAGLAACTGGIRYKGQQFSLTEARFRFHRKGPDDNHVIAMTHEIGHLLGAQHHYGNCTEGRTQVPGAQGSCTVMSGFGSMDSYVFGRLEAAVVRGYAVTYA